MGAPKGNRNAAKENRLWGETIRRVVTQQNSMRLRAAAEKLVEAAEAGDIAALRELGDRLDGKAVQQIAADVDTTLTVKLVQFGNDHSA